MHVDFPKKNYLSIIVPILLAIILAYLAIEKTWFLITYSKHKGYEYGVFGSPTPFAHSLFYSMFYMTGFLGALLLVFNRTLGWVLVQVIVISGMFLLASLIIMSIFTPLNYLSAQYIGLFVLGTLITLFLNQKSVLSRFDISSYRDVIIGLIVVLLTSVIVFDVFSLG